METIDAQPNARRLNMNGAKRDLIGPRPPPVWSYLSVSSSVITAALLSRYSARTSGLSPGSRRNRDRAAIVSSSRCFIISQRGENGAKNIPLCTGRHILRAHLSDGHFTQKKRIQAGMSCQASRRRHETLFSSVQVWPCAA